MKEACLRCIAVVCAILTTVGSSGRESRESQEKILADGGIADLGNHIISYYAQPESRQEKGVEYFVVQDLDSGDILYLPNDFGRIRGISVTGTSEIHIRYTDNGVDGETTIPVRFTNREGEAWAILKGGKKERIIYGTRLNSPVQTEEIWSEPVTMGVKDYRITFERTSPPYDQVLSDMGYRQADYRLTVRDGERNTVWAQEIINYPIEFEEVYWIKDISGDGFPDIIFCAEYNSQPKPYAEPFFLVWDAEKEGYDLRKVPVEWMWWSPRWDEELSALMYCTEGFNEWVSDLNVYTYGAEGWELYAEIKADSENRDTPYFEDYYQKESYYKKLDYYDREIYYENGKAVREERIDSWADSAWKEKYDNGMPLYPQKWEKEEVTLCTGVTVSKYIRPDLEIQKKEGGFVKVSIRNGDGYAEFLNWMAEMPDESVKYLTVDLAGTETWIYLDEILSGRDLYRLTVQNGGNISAKNVQAFAAGGLTRIDIQHVFRIDADVVSHIRGLEEIIIKLDGNYKGDLPTEEMLGNTECKGIVLLWDDRSDERGLIRDGENLFGCLREEDALSRESDGENKWLRAVYRQNEGDYSYTSYDLFQGNAVSDIFLCIEDRESGGEQYRDVLELPKDRLPDMDEGSGSRICLEDIDFDGYEDLIFLGCNDGLRLYLKTVVYLWNEKTGTYEWCSTAPLDFNYIDRERKRVIWSERKGIFEEDYYIYEYGKEGFTEKRLEVGLTDIGEVTWNYYEDGKWQKRLYLSAEDEDGAQYVIYEWGSGSGKERKEGEVPAGTWWQDVGKNFFPEFDFYNNG